MDPLEQKLLMATSPLPVVSGQTGVTSSGTNQDDSAPWVAIDPINPLKMVTVYTHRDSNNGVSIRARAAASVDGGLTWTAFALPDNESDPTTTNPTIQYTSGFASGVGFDRNENFYVGVLEVNSTDGAARSGVVSVDKFSFAGGSPTAVINPATNSAKSIVYHWNQAATNFSKQPGIANFQLAVDANLPSFTDPTTGQVQSDPTSGNVYIAWTRNTPPPDSPPSSFNPYTIELTASSDGVNWPAYTAPTSTPGTGLDGGSFSNPARNTNPRMAIAQGTPGGTNGGNVTVVWDDFGSGTTANPPVDFIRARTVKVSGTTINTAGSSVVTVASTIVRGNLVGNGIFASAASPVGIGPGATVAIDNTLGSYSQRSGRIYVAYVDKYRDVNNEADNSDIFLVASDDGGTRFDAITRVQVNSDSGAHDGHTGGVTPGDSTSPDSAGRSQFQPSIAVDNATGTLVLGWEDARDDAARARTAFYVTTSIDGGLTFSPQAFANAPLVATDGITGKKVTIGPLSDYNSVETSLSIGSHQALAVANGVIHPVWSGTAQTGLQGNRLTIRTAQVTLPAGPRIISSTMGPVASTTVNGLTFNNTFTATDHTPRVDGFAVVFDRPVDISTFTTSQVQVRYRDTVTPLSSPGTVVSVGSVTPLNSFFNGAEATSFFVRFATPQTGTGTYSYTVGPNIRDRLRSPGQITIVANNAPVTYPATIPAPVAIPPTGTVGRTTSTITVSGANAASVLAKISVRVQLTHTYDSDLILTLISPSGTRVVLANQRGGSSDNYSTTVFDDFLGQVGNGGRGPIGNGSGPFNGTYTPDGSLSTLNGGVINGTWTLQIDDVAIGDTGALQAWSLTIDGGLTTVGAPTPGNLMDQNADGKGGQANDFYATPTPILPSSTPFVGPYDTTTLPIILPGPHLTSTFVPFAAATPDNLVLNNSVGYITVVFDRDIDVSSFTPGQILSMVGPAGPVTGNFTIEPEFSAALAPRFPQGDEDATHTRSFRIGFPSFQALSGTYTLTLGTGIRSTRGDLVDANQNAGVDLLFDITNPGSTTANITYNNPTQVAILPGKSLTSTITVNDFYAIKSFVLSLDITYPEDPDLTATLTDPLGNVYRLFTNVGNVVGSHANFSNTIFDNLATTPIQNGSAPFSGRYKPQDSLSALLAGNVQVNGNYVLTITNSGTSAGTLNRWTLNVGEQTRSDTGLGDPVADRSSASFRIFTMDPTNALASNTWTAVGGASNNGNANSSRIGGIALDPSDPSGNTAYVAGASGGIWRTNNFLTTSSNGPTYVPLTDYGPTFGINIGSIAVFGRNNDPRQSIIVGATGEGDINGRGAGFIISFDGGTTWNLFDSTDNTKAFASRDHAFVGTTSYKVLVDPKLSPSGGVIIYAALGGRDGQGNARGGIWRSIDSGLHWTRVKAGNSSTGDATDIVFDPNSGVVDAFTNPTGNIRTLYAAFLGDGVFSSPNQGGVWNQLVGGVGDPLIQDAADPDSASIGVAAPAGTPNGAKGRIVLAKPALTGDANLDIQYQTWLYAAVSTPDGQLDGLYQTKDNGQNWVKVRIPTKSVGVADGFPTAVVPSNDISNPDYNVLRGQGNYNIALNIDPNNPSVVYLGGTRDFQPTTLIRVDTTRVSDAHSLYSGVNTLGNATIENTTDPVTIKDPKNLVLSTGLPNPISNPYINLLRDPNNPFLSDSTIFVTDVRNNKAGAGFSNSGSGAWWTPFVDFLGGQTDIHRIVTLKDPVTGKTRLIVGLDQGVFTGIDNGDGTLLRTIGNQGAAPSYQGTTLPTTGTQVLPTGSRNGNLQINQFYNGAAQPGSMAAQIAGALFYGMAQDNGFPTSDPNVLTNGNITWFGSTGDGQDVATDQTGSGVEYSYRWPCCGGGGTNFFQVSPTVNNPIGRTFGLIQKNQTGKVPDPQWPFLGGFNFAVNPISGDQIILGSGEGRLFGTENQGRIWVVIAEPAQLDGSVMDALAYGAPDPNGPGLPGALNNNLMVGTRAGHIYASFVGGGSSAGNAWLNISNGLDGSQVKRIITNPNRGSHEAYAITSTGVFHNVDTSAANTTWVNVTGDLFQQTHASFGNVGLTDNLISRGSLGGLVADWRYVIPDDPTVVNGPTHPMLYAAGEGGVVRSTDGGKSWRVFPNIDLATPAFMGNLPVANISDLDMVLGNVNPTTGRPDVSTGPNLLLATTYGRGSYGIRLAPIIFNDGTNNLALSKTLPTPDGSDTGKFNNDNITKETRPYFSGLSEQTAFGNQVAVTIYDITVTPSNPTGALVYVGGYNPGDQTAGANGFFNPANQTDGFGRFNVRVNSGVYGPGSDGVRTVVLIATDASGTRGNAVPYTFRLITTPPAKPNAPVLEAASDSGPVAGTPFNADGYTRVKNPTFDVTPTVDNSTITLYRRSTDVASGPYVQVAQVLIPLGAALVPTAITDPGPVPDGHYVYATIVSDLAGNNSPQSDDSAVVTIDSVAPNAPSTPTLTPASDSGPKGDGITKVTNPTFNVSTGEASPTLTYLFRSTDPTQVGVLVATISGVGPITDPGPLASGTYYYRSEQVDLAGNASPISATTPYLTVQIIQAIPGAKPTIALLPNDESGVKGDNTTNNNRPRLFGVAPKPPASGPGYTLELVNATTGAIYTTIAEPNDGNYVIQFPTALADGQYQVLVRVRDVADNTLSSDPITLTILTQAPATIPQLDIDPADRIPADSSTPSNPLINSRSTIVRRPRIIGKAQPGVLVQIYAGGALQATVSTSSDGSFRASLPFELSNGTIQITAKATDVAGNQTPGQGILNLRITFVQGDYNRDGKADFPVYRPSNATWYIASSAGGATATPYGFANHDVPIAGDFFGTGVTNIAVFRPETDQWFLNGGVLGQTVTQFGIVGRDTPVPGVYDSNGRSEIAVYRPDSAAWFILHTNGQGAEAVSFGQPNVDKPVQADYNGIGYDQVAVYRPLELATRAQGGGTFYVRNTDGTTRAIPFAGAVAGDIPVPADYDGIGRAEPALYRPSTGQYLIFNTVTLSYRVVAVGSPNIDVPVPRDYTGDGKVDPAVFHTTNDTFIYLNSGTNQMASVQFGVPNFDVAVAGPLQYRINASARSSTAAVPASSSSSSSGLVRASSASPVVIGSNTPTPPTSPTSQVKVATAVTKPTTRPADSTSTTTARQAVKLSKVKLGKAAAEASHPVESALTLLGRLRGGRFFA